MVDVQFILAALLFILSVAYLIRMACKNIGKKSKSCGGSCKCGVDFDQVSKKSLK